MAVSREGCHSRLFEVSMRSFLLQRLGVIDIFATLIYTLYGKKMCSQSYGESGWWQCHEMDHPFGDIPCSNATSTDISYGVEFKDRAVKI